MCSYITERAEIFGSAKGPAGWMHVDTATVYFDHPFYSPLDHSLNIDFVDESEGAPIRVALELSAESARRLIEKIQAALDEGAKAHIDLDDPLHAHPHSHDAVVSTAG